MRKSTDGGVKYLDGPPISQVQASFAADESILTLSLALVPIS
jgi:hypothetical protein